MSFTCLGHDHGCKSSFGHRRHHPGESQLSHGSPRKGGKGPAKGAAAPAAEPGTHHFRVVGSPGMLDLSVGTAQLTNNNWILSFMD